MLSNKVRVFRCRCVTNAIIIITIITVVIIQIYAMYLQLHI